jgi:hypothetical protein
MIACLDPGIRRHATSGQRPCPVVAVLVPAAEQLESLITSFGLDAEQADLPLRGGPDSRNCRTSEKIGAAPAPIETMSAITAMTSVALIKPATLPLEAQTRI